jgi:glycosyltransferase involved in cell wall biosynthesis
MPKKNRKTLLITNIISPYRLPVYRILARSLSRFSVWFLSRSEQNRQWNIPERELSFPWRVIPGIHLFSRSLDAGLHINPFFFIQLLFSGADRIIVTGYDNPSFWIALFYARLFRKKVIFWNGSTLLSEKTSRPLVKKIKRSFIRSCDAFVTYGSRATEYLVQYGADPGLIVTGCNCVENQVFADQVPGKPQRTQMRKSAGVEGFVILYAGQLIERKGVMQLVECFIRLRKKWQDITLVLAGGGPLEIPIREIAGNDPAVRFEGHVQRNRLIEWYAISDLFVLPSTEEVWGLVVNEAMAMGLPVLVSNKTGVSFDLVENGITGVTFDPCDTESLYNMLDRMLDNRDLTRQYGEAAAKRVQTCSPEAYASSIESAVALTT